jgi:pyruvate dehydrogenase E2 component (dihydrolipoamide acetyltransferase)
MAILLTMPALSPTMETGVISAWNKKVGDKIEPGDLLAEVETDKAVMEWEAADEGLLREILVQPGQELSVGTPVAILADSAQEDISALLAQAKSGQGAAPAPAPAAPQPVPASKPAPPAAAAPKPAPAPAAAKPAPPFAPTIARPAARAPGERIKISPYARKLAGERNLEVSLVTGTGPSGRIVARDVQAAIASGGARAVAAQPVPVPGLAVVAGGEAYEDLPVSMMRKAIARKMEESKRTVPHFQATRKVRMDRVVAMREQLKADFPDVKISINDLIVKACAVALRFHPVVNSQWLGDRIRRFHTIDLSVAVATDEGLITPIVRGADRKTVSQIAQEMRELAERARAKKLAPEEYQGGTFTISNMGMYGITEFNGIINTPQACLLAVSAVVQEPVVESGQIVPGHTMNVTLSSDHRVVDGAMAADFLRTLTRILENPLALVM